MAATSTNFSDKNKKPALAEARAQAEIEARKATERVDQARSKLDADKAAQERVAATTLPLDATDAQIDELALATVRINTRVGLSERALAAAEVAAKAIVEEAARAACAEEHRRIFTDQNDVVERFRGEYPQAVAKLFLLFSEAHAIQMDGQKLAMNPVAGEDPYMSVFRFSSNSPPATLRILVLDGAHEVVWQGDQNSDVQSYFL